MLQIRAGEESAKTAQAIAAFESLAQRLEAMAAQRAIKPWWQRLLRSAGCSQSTYRLNWRRLKPSWRASG